MGYITKKELDRLYNIASTLDDDLERLKELKADKALVHAQDPTTNIGASESNEIRFNTEELLIQVNELERQMAETKVEYFTLVNKLVRSTRELEKKYKDVMHYHYIKGQDWDDVADSLGCSRRTAERNHGIALQKIKGIRVEAGKRAKEGKE